ncbi:MAG: fumarate hydratase, partial [Clostridia bacterium]|nr:fumarate hydratase [Clostridia bacterium]
MRIIEAAKVTEVVRKLCIEANCHLTSDLKDCITSCRKCETFPVAQGILDQIIENYEIADANNVPVCQDTGMACVFIDVGQDVHVEGSLEAAIHEGVR